MYYVYDDDGYYYAKTDSFKWAKRMADACDGYVMEYNEWNEKEIIYDTFQECYFE